MDWEIKGKKNNVAEAQNRNTTLVEKAPLLGFNLVIYLYFPSILCWFIY